MIYDTLYGKPMDWFRDIMEVLEIRYIKDAKQLKELLDTVPRRLPNDWSGY